VVRQLHPIFSCPDSGWLLRPAYRHRLGGDEDADTHGIKIEDKDKKELAEKFSTMPPHAEVPAALRKLRAMQVSGSSLSRTICSKFKPANLSMAGSSICLNDDSLRTVKHYKPSREAYAYVEKAFAALSCRQPHMGHPRRRRGGLRGSADQACRQ
jgi:hypothetical protein